METHHKNAQEWVGRDDPEDGALSKRVHNYVVANGTGNECSRAIIGFASEAGVRRNKGRVGSKEGPKALRAALSGLSTPKDFSSIMDLGDIIVEEDDLEEGQALLGQHIDIALSKYERVVILGGGHETAFGSYLGLSTHYPEKKIGIINLDAHLDLRNIGEKGASSGTPFNQIRNLSPSRFDYLCIGVAAESNTQALLQRANDWGVRIISDHDIIESPDCADREIHEMAKRCDIIYLTIDIDLMPHFQAPGVSAPAARGVPFATVEHLVKSVLKACQKENCLMPLADIVELSPKHDRDSMTAKTAAVLALRLLQD